MKHVILVKLEIEAASFGDAIDAVEWSLDNGTFQDEINERMADEGTEDDAPVTSATCDAESAYRNAILEEAAFECEDRARTNEGSALQSESADASEALWYRGRANALRDTAERIRGLKT